MMRTIILFILAAQTVAFTPPVQCSIDVTQAVDDMMDSIVYLWASVERCSKGDVITCQIDVSSSVQTITSVINVIVRALRDCGHMQTNDCGVAAGTLTESTAGLASAAGGILKECNTAPRPALPATGKFEIVVCIVDVKDATKSLFKGITSMLAAKTHCTAGDQQSCGADAMRIISAFAAMSQYIAGSIARCQKRDMGVMQTINTMCGEKISSFIRFSTDFAASATKMSAVCKAGAARLYELHATDAKVQSSSVSTMTLSLFALLPLTGLVAFQGGSRFAKFRQAQAEERDLELIAVNQPID